MPCIGNGDCLGCPTPQSCPERGPSSFPVYPEVEAAFKVKLSEALLLKGRTSVSLMEMGVPDQFVRAAISNLASTGHG